MIEIDYKLLEPATLNNVLKEIVIREGTDYGAAEVAMEDKCEQLYRKLQAGEAILVFHTDDGFCDVIKKT